jgi:hypothetical protein
MQAKERRKDPAPRRQRHRWIGNGTQCVGAWTGSKKRREEGKAVEYQREEGGQRRGVTVEGVPRRHPATSRHHAATSRRLFVASCAASGRASPRGDFNTDLRRWGSVLGIE